MSQRRPASKKTQEKKHAPAQTSSESQGTSIASVVKARTSERARAQILSILKEAIHKMEAESKSQFLASVENNAAASTEATEPVHVAAHKASTRSRTANASHKKSKKPDRDHRLSMSHTQTALLSSQTSQNASLTTSALRTSRRRAKSTENVSSMQRSKGLDVESSIASLQTENMHLESKLRKLGEQLKKEQKERASLESRLAAIESSAQASRAHKPSNAPLSPTEVPQNSPSMQTVPQPM